MPLIKAQNKRLKREIDDLKKQFRQASAHFGKAEERAYTRALAELTAKQEAAVESGDLAAHRAVSKEIDELSKEMPGKPANTATAEEAREAFDEWREQNAWYDRANLASAAETDVNARLYADRMTEKHIDKTKDMPPAEFFAFIGDLVKEKYPLIGRKPAREKPPSDVALPPRPCRHTRQGMGRHGARGAPDRRAAGREVGQIRPAEEEGRLSQDYDWSKK
jgi:hypothetical protein